MHTSNLASESLGKFDVSVREARSRHVVTGAQFVCPTNGNLCLRRNTVVTVAEAATRLAVSRSLIRKLASGRLTRVRIGRCVRVRAEELDALIAGRDPPKACANGRARIEEESTFIDD